MPYPIDRRKSPLQRLLQGLPAIGDRLAADSPDTRAAGGCHIGGQRQWLGVQPRPSS